MTLNFNAEVKTIRLRTECLEAVGVAEAKILASMPVWPRGLNITGSSHAIDNLQRAVRQIRLVVCSLPLTSQIRLITKLFWSNDSFDRQTDTVAVNH